MPTNPPPVSDALSDGPDTHAMRWEGHMADDVASTYGSEPCAALTATPDELRLKGNRGDFRLPRSAITRISRGGLYPWFFKGIRIRHLNTKISSNLQFRTLTGKTNHLLAQLKTLGYPTA
ncbi:MAG: hypothetical protein IPL39_21930 [Opitutaceae bacterium]|nr:hypothetical protein [Opitutaceae bacterium]